MLFTERLSYRWIESKEILVHLLDSVSGRQSWSILWACVSYIWRRRVGQNWLQGILAGILIRKYRLLCLHSHGKCELPSIVYENKKECLIDCFVYSLQREREREKRERKSWGYSGVPTSLLGSSLTRGTQGYPPEIVTSLSLSLSLYI